MQFELHIICSKDIERLSIDFTDGTTVVQSKEQTSKQKLDEKKISKEKISKDFQACSSRENTILDTESKYEEISQEVVQKPIIERKINEIKVAEEIQNMTI